MMKMSAKTAVQFQTFKPNCYQVQTLDMNDLKELFPSEYASESAQGVQAKRKLSIIREDLIKTVEQYQTTEASARRSKFFG